MSASSSRVFVFPGSSEELTEYDYGQPVHVTVWELLLGGPETLGTGTVTYEGRFDWTFKYDIAYYILEGHLTLRSEPGEQTAGPGDFALIHRGAQVEFEAPKRCRAFWALYPSDWLGVSNLTVEDDADTGLRRLVERA